MLNTINNPITKLFAAIQNAVNDNAACETAEQERAYMVAGGKERVYLQQLATRLTGNLLKRLTSCVIEDQTITVFPDGMKTSKGKEQNLNASIYMVACYSVIMSGYTSANILHTALENWIDEDSIIIEPELNYEQVSKAIIIQFIKDGIISKDLEDGQTEDGQRFQGHATTAEIQELRINTMVNLWDNATPKMKPMLHKLTWSIDGTCELQNFTFKEQVQQPFVDALNRMGHTGYKLNGAIRAQIKRKLKRNEYPKDQVQAMKSMLKLDVNKTYYFPHTPDYRGRAYARGGLTTFQGVKDIRACFDFATYTKVDEYGLFLHIANACGYDKDSITNRMQWVKDNHISLMTTPQPTLYAERARLAYIEYKTSGLTNIICRIDGTCSGVQLTSGLFLDAATAKAVNVSASSPDDTPEDCYGLVADTALLLARKATDKNILKKYHRDITKKVVMILAYGAGETTLIRTVREFLIENKERATGAKSLYKIIMQAIEQAFPAITKLNEHLQLELECSPLDKVVYKLSDITIKIKPMNSEYLNLYGTSYSAKLQGKSLPDAEALARGLAPNFVHGLDAELLRKAVNIVDSDVSCIHDDLGVQSCDVRKTLQAVRVAYVEVIKAEPLKTLYTAMDIEDEYEKEDNGLNLNDVLESTYLFS